MSEESYIYCADVIISPHTNKPYIKPVSSSEETLGGNSKFWCSICNRMITGIISSVRHMSGKAHKLKLVWLNVKATETEIDNQPDLKCDDCHIVFRNAVNASNHFKGMKHIRKISAKNQTDYLSKENVKNIPDDRNIMGTCGSDLDQGNPTDSAGEEHLAKKRRPRRKKRKADTTNIENIMVKQEDASEDTNTTLDDAKELPIKKSKQTTSEIDNKPDLKCDDCDMVFRNAVNAANHFQGKKHIQRCAKISAKNQTDKNILDDIPDIPDGKNLPDNKNGNITGKCGSDLDDGNSTVSTGEEEPLAKRKKPRRKKRKADTTNGENITENKEDGTLDSAKELPSKKTKKTTSEIDKADLKCDDCNKVFQTAMNAINHFKGKAHIKKISAVALAKQEARNKSMSAQRGTQRGRGYGARRGINPSISSLQGNLHTRVNKFLSTRGVQSGSSNYGTTYDTNNISAPFNKHFTSTRFGTSNDTLQTRDIYDEVGQQNTYGTGTRATPTYRGSPPRDSRQSNFGKTPPPLQNYHTESSSTQRSPLGGASNGYYSNDYNTNNEIRTNQHYGLFY